MKLSNPTVAEHGAPEADVDTHLIDLTHQADVDAHLIDLTHQAVVDTHQADVDTHQTDVDTYQADVETHQADVDIHQTDDSHLKGTDTSVAAERKGKSGNIQSGSSAVALGCLGKKRKLPGWLSMGSVDGDREESKEKKAKGNSVHRRPLYLEECILLLLCNGSSFYQARHQLWLVNHQPRGEHGLAVTRM